jgi:hypothetical protein
MSFLLGLGAAWALPVVAKSLRALAVEATAAGMTLVEEGRRILAEKLETLEDIAAEARARREELQAQAEAAQADAEGAEPPGGAEDEEVTAGSPRRRAGARRATAAAR